VEIPLGSAAQLVCTGHQSEWFFNNGSLPNNSRLRIQDKSSVLSLYNIALHNKGYYTCMASKTSTIVWEDTATIRVIGT